MKKLLITKYVAVMFSALLLSNFNAVAAENTVVAENAFSTDNTATSAISTEETGVLFCIDFPAGFGYKCFDI